VLISEGVVWGAPGPVTVPSVRGDGGSRGVAWALSWDASRKSARCASVSRGVSRDRDLVPCASLGIMVQRGTGGTQLLQEPGIVSTLRGSRLLDQGMSSSSFLAVARSGAAAGSSPVIESRVDEPEQCLAVLRISGHGDPEKPQGRRAVMPGQRQLAAQPRQGRVKWFPIGEQLLG